MLVDFSDGKLSLGNIFTTATRKAQGNQGVLDNFNNIDNLSYYFDNDKFNWKKLTDKIGEVDSVTKRYLNDCIDLDTQTIKNKASIEDLANAYKQSGHSLEGFISGLKGIATNMAVMLAISLAIKGAMYIWDELNVTYEEQAKIVSDLNDEIKSLEEEEQKLLDLRDEGGLTEAEQSRLDYLQQRLELDKQIYKQEQRKLADSELYGKGDLLSTGILGEGGKAEKTKNSYDILSGRQLTLMGELDNALKYRSEYEPDSFLFNAYDKEIKRTTNRLEGLKSSLLDTKSEYLKYAQAISNDIDSGAYDDDISKKNQLEQTYQDYLDMANKISNDIIEINTKLNIINEDTYKSEIINYFKSKNTEFSQELQDAQQNLEDEYAKIQDWGLGIYADKIKDGTIQSKFGNVDMDKRTIITWSDELKKTYAEELKSWDYDPEIGSIDTVFGGSERFGEELNGVGWEVAFTPILPDGTLLSRDTVSKYFESIIAEAYSDDKTVTLDELKSIDAQGRQIGETFVQGIFAAIDDSMDYENNGNYALDVGKLLHFVGKFGAVEIAKDAINELKDFDAEAEEYVNSLNEEESRVVTLGIKDGSIETVNDMTKAVDAFREAKEKANKEELKSTDFSTTIKSASEYASELDSLSKIYQDVQDKGTFDFSSLGDSTFVEKFGKYKEEYQAFVDTVTNSPNDINACQKAFDDLATAWLNGSGILDNLTESNKDYYTALLKSNGISNASEIVQEQLNKQTAQSIVSKYNLIKATDSEITALLAEADAAGIARDEIYKLVIQQIAFNDTGLDVSDKIAALNTLNEATNGNIASLATLMELLNRGTFTYDAGGHVTGYTYKQQSSAKPQEYNGIEVTLTPNDINSMISNFASQIKTTTTTAKVNDYNPTTPSGGGSSKTEPYKAEIDALQDYLDAYEKAQRKREQIDKKYDNAKTTAEKIDLMQQRIDAMREEQKAIEALNDARDKEIQKNVETLRAQQFDISYDPTTDELQIKNIEHLNELKGENQEKTNKLIQDTEEMINTTKEMADANKDLADTWQDNVYTLSDYADELLELQETLHDEKITDIEFKIDVADELNRVEDKIDGLTEKITQTIDDLNKAYAMGLDNTSDYVQSLIKELMDAANDIKEAQKEIYENKRDDYDSAKNAVVKVIENNIEALQKQKEELEALNDEQDRALQLAKLKEALLKAEQSKVIQVYRKNVG